jgi:hypothetical protein
MPHTDTGLFTVGVFKDVEWAARGLDALKAQGFTSPVVTILAKHTPETAELVRRVTGTDGAALEVRTLGPVVAVGSLVEALQGDGAELTKKGLAGSMRRVGFQPHDGLIYEKLTERGGVLVAVNSESRAADALAVLHAFGGGNAAIGAWGGRV